MQVHAFAEGSPYADSELIADYGANPPAAIRCDLKPSVLGPILCDRMIRISAAIMGRLRFTRGNAGDWREIENAVLALTRVP